VDLENHFSTSLTITRSRLDIIYFHSPEGATALLRTNGVVLHSLGTSGSFRQSYLDAVLSPQVVLAFALLGHHPTHAVVNVIAWAIWYVYRTYREYKLCVRPIKKACRRGVQLVYDHQSALRLYRLKMDFICSKNNRQRE